MQKRHSWILRAFFNSVVGINGYINTHQLKLGNHVNLFDFKRLAKLGDIGADVNVIYLNDSVNTIFVFHYICSPL